MTQFYFYSLHLKNKLKNKTLYVFGKRGNAVKRRKILLARGWELAAIDYTVCDSRLLFFYNVKRKQRLEFRDVNNMYTIVLYYIRTNIS